MCYNLSALKMSRDKERYKSTVTLDFTIHQNIQWRFQGSNPEIDMGWINPRVELGWVRFFYAKIDAGSEWSASVIVT